MMTDCHSNVAGGESPGFYKKTVLNIKKNNNYGNEI